MAGSRATSAADGKQPITSGIHVRRTLPGQGGSSGRFTPKHVVDERSILPIVRTWWRRIDSGTSRCWSTSHPHFAPRVFQPPPSTPQRTYTWKHAPWFCGETGSQRQCLMPVMASIPMSAESRSLRSLGNPRRVFHMVGAAGREHLGD